MHFAHMFLPPGKRPGLPTAAEEFHPARLQVGLLSSENSDACEGLDVLAHRVERGFDQLVDPHHFVPEAGSAAFQAEAEATLDAISGPAVKRLNLELEARRDRHHANTRSAVDALFVVQLHGAVF